MKFLLKSIKARIASNVAALSNRIALASLGENIKLTDSPGPYCRVSLVGQEDTGYGFQDTVGVDETVIQFSVFAETLVAANDLVDSIITAFQGVGLTLDVGPKAYGTKRKRGFFAEPKSPDAKRVFHAWVTIQFIHEDQLS